MNAYVSANQNFASAVSIPAVAAMMARCPVELDEEDHEAMAVEFADKLCRRRRPDYSKPSRALINRAALRSAVEIVKHVAEKRSSIDILSNVRIISEGENVIVTATNLDTEIHVTIPAAGDLDFGVTIPAHMLESILKKASPSEFIDVASPGTVMREKPNGETYEECAEPARIELERSEYDLKALPVVDFPSIEATEATNEFSMNGATFRDMLDRTRGSVSTEETRYYLNGVFLHTVETGNMLALRAVATDGHRLFMQEIEAPAGVLPGLGIKADWQPGAILPRGLIDLFLRLSKGKACPDAVKITASAARFDISFDNVRIASKLIDGTYPDYQRCIPAHNEFVATFKASEMLSAIDDVTVISTERGRAVRMDWGGDGCTLSTNNPDVGNARSEAACTLLRDGETAHGFSNGYNAKYLSEILKEAAPNGGEVTMEMDGSAGGPAVIRGENEGWLGVIMPMRV